MSRVGDDADPPDHNGFVSRYWFVLALVVGLPLLCLIVWGTGLGKEPLPMVKAADRLGDHIVDTLMTLIAVSLFVERALEVVVKSSRALGRTEKDNAVLACDKTVEDRLEQITTLRERIANPTLRNQSEEMQAQLDEANRQLEEARRTRKKAMQAIQTYRTQTMKMVHLAALVVGVFVATAGVRALEPLFQWEVPGAIPSFFKYVDTLLTAGLIAGGADGLHKLVALATTYFDVSRDRLSGKPPPGS